MARIDYRRYKARATCGLVLIVLVVSACASNEQLFVDYRRDFCVTAVNPSAAVSLEHRKRLAIAPAELYRWEPAVYFESDEYQLGKTATDTLDGNVAFLLKFPTNRVSIRGFTDQHATNQYNLRLSEKRAERVVNYLREKGIKRDRMIVHALGESLAHTSDGEPTTDESSRRVEMVLLDVDGWPAAIFKSLE